MDKIEGPITFEAGKELPQKMKNWIKKNGMKVPFKMADFKYSNTKIDKWFRAKENGKKYKMDRTKDKMIEDKTIEAIEL